MADYPYTAVNLTPKIAVPLLLELLKGGQMRRAQIIDAVKRLHEQKGGASCRGGLVKCVQKALKHLVYSGAILNPVYGVYLENKDYRPVIEIPKGEEESALDGKALRASFLQLKPSSKEVEMKSCDCGCGNSIPMRASDGSIRKYLQGHQNKKRRVIEERLCECGCGKLIKATDAKGRPRRFAFGHHKAKNNQNNLAAWNLSRKGRRDIVPWNKGRTYVSQKRAGTYANRGSWMKALNRIYKPCCMICGWDKAPCDCHHIIERKNGGKNELNNGIILCPNCHRLVHVGQFNTEALLVYRSKAIPSESRAAGQDS